MQVWICVVAVFRNKSQVRRRVFLGLQSFVVDSDSVESAVVKDVNLDSAGDDLGAVGVLEKDVNVSDSYFARVWLEDHLAVSRAAGIRIQYWN